MGLEQDILKAGSELLSEKRWSHSLRTAEFGHRLALRYSADAELVRLASLSHDLAREQKPSVIYDWALLDQEFMSGFCLAHPVLLHGFASSWMLRRDFGVSDTSLLNAVRYHTTGHPVLDREGLIVFAADYMEPGRTHLTEKDREALIDLPLDGMVLSILDSMEKYLLSRNEDPSPDSRELYQMLKKRYNKSS